MRLESIAASQRKKDHFVVKLENGDSFVCTAAEAADYALYAGRELTGQELDALRAASALSKTRPNFIKLFPARKPYPPVL